MDDVSVNISKQWNKHHVIYMSNAFMSCEMLEKEFCVRFVSSSPHMAPLELMKAAETGVLTWNSKYQEEIMLIPYDLFYVGNNPMQAEECSHRGLKCNFFCHTCKVGGTMVAKKIDDGYTSIFKCSELWMVDNMLANIKEQINLAKLSSGTEKVKNNVSMTGMHDAASTTIIQHLLELGKQLLAEGNVCAALEKDLEELLKDKTIDNYINPLLGIPDLDIHKDTQTEILHTILLRIVKYYWGQMVFILDKSHSLRTFQVHLDSLVKDGLGDVILGIDYISLAQVMPYLIYDLIPRTVLDGWTIIGQLVNTETYLVHTNNIMPTWILLT
ncbi:hypothetical protein HD554DRAFT_2205888 [Boletus coccyginus]|nr:hypothetical protein HD554DRAFT_2205888 [Boletus coccyginus]